MWWVQSKDRRKVSYPTYAMALYIFHSHKNVLQSGGSLPMPERIYHVTLLRPASAHVRRIRKPRSQKAPLPQA